MEIQEITYTSHGFIVSRKIYLNLEQEDIPKEKGQIIQEANEPESEFRVLQVFEKEILAEDLEIKIQRVLYKDSCRISEKEKLRQKKHQALLNKNTKAKLRLEKKQAKALKQAERAYKKQQREQKIKKKK